MFTNIATILLIMDQSLRNFLEMKLKFYVMDYCKSMLNICNYCLTALLQNEAIFKVHIHNAKKGHFLGDILPGKNLFAHIFNFYDMGQLTWPGLITNGTNKHSDVVAVLKYYCITLRHIKFHP